LQRALELNPLDFETQRELASAYATTGRVQEAESVYLRAIKSRGNCWQAYNRLGVFYDGYGRCCTSRWSATKTPPRCWKRRCKFRSCPVRI
jgi:Flp pilus assembly protein TadD